MASNQVRIKLLDSLRGLCAIWVFFLHLANVTSFNSVVNLGPIYSGRIPVNIFFIMSGFVLAGMLKAEKDQYFVYLFKRYFRVAPVFIVMCLIYAASFPIILDALLYLDTDRGNIRERYLIYVNSVDHIWYHLVAHSTLLHGLFDGSLPSSTKAIITPGWSMTVEWQFYLIAPLAFLIIRNSAANRAWYVSTVLLILILKLSLTARLGFLVSHIETFVLGMFSWSLWTKGWRYEGVISSPNVVFASCLIIVSGVSGDGYDLKNMAKFAIAACIWFVVIDLAHARERPSLLESIKVFFENPAFLWLGKVSYSVYLNHMLVIYVGVYLLSRLSPVNLSESQMFFLLLLPSFCVTLIFSHYTSLFVEIPVTRWAKNFANKKATVEHI